MMQGLMKEFMIILITSLVVGIGSSYVLNTIQLAKLEERSFNLDAQMDTRAKYVDKQIGIMEEVVKSLQIMQIELSRRGEWMDWVTREVVNLQEKTTLRYTAIEAEKDLFRIRTRLDKLEEAK